MKQTKDLLRFKLTHGKLFPCQLACYKTSEKSWHLSQPKQSSWVKYANRNLFINGSSNGFLKRTWKLSTLPCTCATSETTIK